MSRRFLLTLPWIFGSGLVVIVFLIQLVAVCRGAVDPNTLWRNDFTNFWAGGRFIEQQDFVGLYDANRFAQWQWDIFGPFGPRYFSYPPSFYPVAQAQALLPYKAALLIWVAVSGGGFLFAARHYWPTRSAGPVWLVLLTPAAVLCMTMGQLGFLFGALWLGVFAMLDKRPVLAGVMIAAFIMKPQLAVLIPFMLMLSGRWKSFAWAAGATGLFLGAIVLAYGPSPWIEYFDVAAPRQSSFIHIANGFSGIHTVSTFSVVEFVTGSTLIGWAAHVLVGCWAIWVVIDAIRRKVPTLDLGLVSATATFLILPYALSYDLVVPALAAWRIIVNPVADRETKALAVIGFIGPQMTILSTALTDVPLLPMMTALLLAAQHRMIRSESPADPIDAGAMR